MYFMVFGTGVYYMLKLVASGPDHGPEQPRRRSTSAAAPLTARPARPLSAAPIRPR